MQGVRRAGARHEIGILVLAYTGIGRLRNAASSPSTQAFLLIGTLFPLPVILLYPG